MRKFPRRLQLALTLLLAVALLQIQSESVVAQQPRLPVSKLAADMVRINRGPTLYGAIVDRDETGNVTLAVNRAWLKKTHRAYYDVVVERDAEFVETHHWRLLDRIDAWRKKRKDDVGIQVFLDKETKRLTELPASASAKAAGKSDPSKGDAAKGDAAKGDAAKGDAAKGDAAKGDAAKDDAAKDDAGKGEAAKAERAKAAGGPAELMTVEILASEIKSAYAQPTDRRRLLQAAWKHNVRNAVTRTPLAISRELERLGVEWRREPSGPIAAGATSDTDEQWATRMSLVEFRLRKSLRFQGAGSFIARTGAGADDVAMKDVMARVLKDQLTEQLNALLGGAKPRDDGKWLEQAIREAEKEDVLGFRVARLEKDTARGSASVDISFYAKMPDGEWAMVFQTRATQSTATVKRESLEEVAGSDEVKNIIGLLKGAGLPMGEATINRALGFGAATKEAMNQAHLQFVNFINPYTKRLDSPAIRSRRALRE